MADERSSEAIIRPTVTLWSHLSADEQNDLRNEAMARFPEVFGTDRSKYQGFAAWLAAHHGVVDSSLRDRFSAGGKVDLTVGNICYRSLPRVFSHLQVNADKIIEIVKKMSPDDACYYWGLPFKPESEKQLLSEWVKKLILHSGCLRTDSEQFIVHLLGVTFTGNDCPDFVMEKREHYKV